MTLMGGSGVQLLPVQIFASGMGMEQGGGGAVRRSGLREGAVLDPATKTGVFAFLSA